MNLTYRTRRRLKGLLTVLLFLLTLTAVGWFCWVVWVERYIVYTADGATLNLELSPEAAAGEVALAPVAGEGPGIHYNEGEDAVNVSQELYQISGYYITYDMLAEDVAAVQETVSALPSGTAVMIDLKGGWGSFYYSSAVDGAIISQSVDTDAVDELITYMNSRNLYLIARIPAFRDYSYGLNHVTSGLSYTGGGGALWMDDGGCYWLDPTDSAVLGWITSIVIELRGLGFNEVVLENFSVPENTRVVYSGDRETDLLAAANTLLTACTTNYFTLSFSVSSATFPLPDGRCRMYLSDVSPASVDATAAQVTFSDPEIRLVFLAGTKDTRYDAYCVLRSLDMAELDEE